MLKRNSKQNKNKRSRRHRLTKTIISRKMHNFIVNDTCIVTLSATSQITKITSSNGYFLINANAPNDPFGSSSDPPIGFSQYLQFYDRWVVIDTKVKVQIMNVSGSTITPLNGYWVALYPTNRDDSAIDTFVEASNQRFVTTRMLGGIAGMMY